MTRAYTEELRSLIQEARQFLENSSEEMFATVEESALFSKEIPISLKPMGKETIIPFTAAPSKKLEKIAPLPLEKPLPPSAPVSNRKSHEPQEKPHSHPSGVKNILQKIAPSMRLLDEALPEVSQEVLLIACAEEELGFLKNLAKAINERLTPAKILSAEKIEQEDGWERVLQRGFRLVIVSSKITDFPLLQSHCREKTSIGQSPLLTLSPIVEYNATEQKAALWKTLCQTLRS